MSSHLASSIGSAVRQTVARNRGLVKVVDTEANILTRDSDPVGSIALASDSNKLLIYLGSSWGAISITI